MPQSQPRAQPIKILILHSNPEASAQIKTLLAEVQGSIFVIESLSGLQPALGHIRKNKADVILSSLALEDAGGFDVIDQLQKAAPRIPLFILGETRDDALALRAVASGAHDYLVRSTFNSTMLSRVLRYAIERKKSESSIYIAEEKYRTVFEKSAVAITVTDGQKKIISWNHNAELLLDMSREDLLNRPVSELYPQEQWERIRCYQDEGHSIHDYLETQIIRKDGILVDVGLSISVIKDPDGQITGSIGVLQDISERKRIDRMKDEFISTVSHELRTPLTIIREGVSQVLDRILGDINADQQLVLGLALDGIDRLTRIVNDLLDMSRLEAGKVHLHREQVSLTQIVDLVFRSFQVRAQTQEVQLTVKTPAEVTVWADRDKIIQVLTNLISNAFKFTEKGRIEIGVTESKNEVIVSVTDSGRGIAEQDIGKLFQKFQQFGRMPGPGDKGTGLGLAICKGLLDLHGSHLQVESTLGKGSRFSFALSKSAQPPSK